MDRDQLVRRIYDAATDTRAIGDVLAAIARAVEASCAHLFVVGGRGHLVESHFFGQDAGAFADYETHWRARDPRFALGNAHVGRMLSDVEWIDPSAFDRSEIYNDFLGPGGVRYTLFGQIALDDGLMAAQAFMRERRAGPFEAEQVRDTMFFLPHLRRSLELRRLVDSCRAELRELRAALDLVPTPLAIVDDTGRLLCASAAAARIFEAADGLRLRQERLSADVTCVAHELTAAVARTSRFADAPRRAAEPFATPTVVEVPRKDRRPLALLLLPLRPRNALREEGDARGRVLVVLDDPETAVRLDPAVLRELYPLTPTEASLASTLASGGTLADFARARGCSEETARTHLKRVLDKTETHRQAELVHLLLGRLALQFVASR